MKRKQSAREKAPLPRATISTGALAIITVIGLLVMVLISLGVGGSQSPQLPHDAESFDGGAGDTRGDTMKPLLLLLAIYAYSEHARRIEAEENLRRRDLIELVERLECQELEGPPPCADCDLPTAPSKETCIGCPNDDYEY